MRRLILRGQAGSTAWFGGSYWCTPVSGSTDRISTYRTASESLHRDHAVVAARERATLTGCFGIAAWPTSSATISMICWISPEGVEGLDAGCGTGFDALSMPRRRPRLTVCGVDVSGVALASGVADPASKTIFYQAALERLPFADSSFDCIWSHDLIEHVEDPAVALLESSRVLKPGGICVIATPNGANWWIEHLRQRLMRLTGRRVVLPSARTIRDPRILAP